MVGVGVSVGMVDMLVRLYALPEVEGIYARTAAQGVVVRRPRAFEKLAIEHWVGENFSPKWVSEVSVAMSRQPPSCFIATREQLILGFVCYDVTARGFLGPMGVGEKTRGSGLGQTLLFKALEALREDGYAYAIIGGVGPREFYAKSVGASVIEGSAPGIYTDLLPDPTKN